MGNHKMKSTYFENQEKTKLHTIKYVTCDHTQSHVISITLYILILYTKLQLKNAFYKLQS